MWDSKTFFSLNVKQSFPENCNLNVNLNWKNRSDNRKWWSSWWSEFKKHRRCCHIKSIFMNGLPYYLSIVLWLSIKHFWSSFMWKKWRISYFGMKIRLKNLPNQNVLLHKVCYVIFQADYLCSFATCPRLYVFQTYSSSYFQLIING